MAESGGFTPRTVVLFDEVARLVLFDEAGTAPTRPSAALLAWAERAATKVIAAGDGGQLPSVAAGGWFTAVAQRLGGPELRQVMRQRDPAEREALEAVHEGDPEPYLTLKCEQGALAVHEREHDALSAIPADCNQARLEHGLSQAVMIARDNATSAMLNDRARELLAREGDLAAAGVTVADWEFRVGDRVIAEQASSIWDVRGPAPPELHGPTHRSLAQGSGTRPRHRAINIDGPDLGVKRSKRC